MIDVIKAVEPPIADLLELLHLSFIEFDRVDGEGLRAFVFFFLGYKVQ